MKIENNDIDCMIDVSVFLKEMAEHPEYCYRKKPFDQWHAHIKKIYILLLQASEKGQAGIEHLLRKGIPADSPTAKAVKMFCPEICLN